MDKFEIFLRDLNNDALYDLLNNYCNERVWKNIAMSCMDSDDYASDVFREEAINALTSAVRYSEYEDIYKNYNY